MLEKLIKGVTEPLCRDEKVRGVLLTGSRARGDALKGSDVDFLVLTAPHPEQTFVSETVDGVLVERHIRDGAGAKARLLEHPPELYSYLDGKILYDPEGLLAELIDIAKARFETYQTPTHEKSAVFYWLSSVRIKLQAALDARDLLKMGYYASINSWKVLEGLWALNDKPMPPAGAVWAHMADLTRRPEGLDLSLRALFESETKQQAKRMCELIDWLLENN